MKRREWMIGMGVASLSATVPAMVSGAKSESSEEPGAGDEVLVPGADEKTELLFVQNAHGVSLDGGVLRLKRVAKSTLYFSDRPEHLVGHWDTTDFVANWATGGDDSFKAMPPNAALSVLTEADPENIVVVLRNPRFDAEDLVYDVEVLEGAVSVIGEGAALFIDTIGRPLSPGSVAGVHRRHRRRRRRRVIRN